MYVYIYNVGVLLIACVMCIKKSLCFHLYIGSVQ